MAEEPGQMSVKERIAQLKLNQVGRVPDQTPPPYEQVTNGTTWAKKRPPPPPRPDIPARPNAHGRAQSTNVPTIQNHIPNGGIGNQPETDRPVANANGIDGISRPALPPRNASQASQGPSLPPRKASGPSPGLPPRRPSGTPSHSDYQLSRRGSNESVSSIATARSSVSGISTSASFTSQSDRSVKAPSYDPSSLPQLPPKRTTEEKQAYYNSGTKTGSSTWRRPLKSTYSSPNIAEKQVGTTPPPPRRPSVQPPPALPSRTASIQEEQPLQIEQAPRTMPTEPPRPKRSALEMGMNSGIRPPPNSARASSLPQTNGPPPPIPTASRPDLATLQASKPKPNGGATAPGAASLPSTSCLHCRDFSGPDNHAARFPRESLPRQDIGWLANQLTAPFQSETDKARAIFTWLHHNVAYDTVAFFSNNVKPSTPQKTLETGLAVCEGYAGLFAALAMKAGLEAYVVSGHGKGYGYSKRRPGDPIPTYKAGHAWNAVKIDGGQWKLTDPCWGAGTVNGANQPYTKRFAPERFTQSNEDFGMDHFPGDKSMQFRSDGRTVDWESYILGEKNGCGADFFSGFIGEEGLTAKSFTPVTNPIALSQQGPTVRFSFQKICPHWDPVRCGKGPYYLYVLHMEGLDGTDRNHVPFESNGEVWWCDVPVRDLGRAGQKVQIYTVPDFDGRSGRGLSVQEYRQRKGRVAMMFGGVCKWEVA
ncbi:hypothetical protein LTR85_004273 [Meristemomyces frigidus]|nr:hypothetical protein LTR85_004273 [Meristemomyces frigidus]